MSKPLETNFKRIETKYVIAKEDLKELLADLSPFMREDEYPISNISNIYFDTPEFDVINDSIEGKHKKEKIRMRTYLTQPLPSSQVFLEVKSEDDEGIGHKSRLVAKASSVVKLMAKGILDSSISDDKLLTQLAGLRRRYPDIEPRMFIAYDRYSLKERKHSDGTPFNKIRITFDQNLVYRDEKVNLFSGREGEELFDKDYLIMEIKAPGIKPDWLQTILDKHGLTQVRFSKYSAAYHKSQGLAYEPTPAYIPERVVN